MDTIERVQSYLRYKAQAERTAIAAAPFTVFIHEQSTDLGASFAIPDASAAPVEAAALAPLRDLFARRGCTACIQFLDRCAPTLAATLVANNFVERERAQMLVCTAETYQAPHDAANLSIELQDASTPFDSIREGWRVNAEGFGEDPAQATDDEIKAFQQSLITSRAATARWDGQPVGAGMFIEIHEGVTELVGITTLAPFRRRGIAAAITARLTQAAFASGAAMTFLTAANEEAGRVYQRVGYQPCGWLRTFDDTQVATHAKESRG